MQEELAVEHNDKASGIGRLVAANSYADDGTILGTWHVDLRLEREPHRRRLAETLVLSSSRATPPSWMPPRTRHGGGTGTPWTSWYELSVDSTRACRGDRREHVVDRGRASMSSPWTPARARRGPWRPTRTRRGVAPMWKKNARSMMVSLTVRS